MADRQCVNCGSIAFQNDNECRRCGTYFTVYPPQPVAPTQSPVPGGLTTQPTAYGTSNQPGYFTNSYVEPVPAIWREGNKLVIHKNATLPDRCIKCNAPTHGSSLLRRLNWYHPLLNLLAFAGLAIFLILVAVLRKSAKVNLSICQAHIRRYRTAVMVSWILGLAGIAGLILAVGERSAAIAIIGAVLLVAAIVYAVVEGQLVRVTKIDDDYIWLSHVNQEFLASFPQR